MFLKKNGIFGKYFIILLFYKLLATFAIAVAFFLIL